MRNEFGFLHHNLTKKRQLSLEVFSSVIGRIAHMPAHQSLSCEQNSTLASSTTSELFIRKNVRTSTMFSKLLNKFQTCRISYRALEQNVAQREKVGNIAQFYFLPAVRWISLDLLIHHAESLPSLNFSEIISSSAWVSNFLATATEFFCFFGSPIAFSVCWNAHLFPSWQLVDERSTHVDANYHTRVLLETRRP